MKTYQLVTTRRPFEVICHEKELIPQFQVVLGAIPEKWVQDAFSSGKGIPGTSGKIQLIDRILTNCDR